MTVIDQMKNEIRENVGTLVWSANLTAALGDPHNWEYTGKVLQGDPQKTHCACGHPIRDCYIIREKATGVEKMLGSTCIEYFENVGEIYTNLCEAVKRQEAKLAEAKRAAKKAADEAKVSIARAEYEARYDTLLARYKEYRNRHELAPRQLWVAMASYYRVFRTAPEYQRPCDYLRWYAKQMKTLENL